jgi:hypothetical protein
VPVAYAWRGAFTAAELNVLHAEGFEHDLLDWDWREQVERHSLGWVTARATSRITCGRSISTRAA